MVHWRAELNGTPPLDPIWTNPRWPMWYLAVLIIWRLASPLLRWHWVMVPISIGISLVAGATNQELFDLNRAMGLLPFFVIGLRLPAAGLEVVRRRHAWVAGLVFFGLIWWLADHTNDFWSTQWLYYRTSYADLGADLAQGAWTRARLIVVSLVGCFAAMTLVPHRRSILSDMGAYSLVVYLMHGFFIRYVEYLGYEEWMPDNAALALLITVVLGVLLALFLAWPPVASSPNYLVDPVNSVLKLRAGRAVATRD